MERSVQIVCSACLTEACAQGVMLCEDSRKASFTLTHALHEDGCPICSTATTLIRNILEAVCQRDGISLESGFVPGEAARNFELADRLGISHAFALSSPSAPPGPVSPPTGPQRTPGQTPHATTDDQPHTGTPRHPSTDSDPSSPPCHHTQDT